MQVRLTEDDEEDRLIQLARPSQVLNVREEQRNGEAANDSLLRYLIVAGLVLVVVILLNSSHQKVRIVYSAPKEGKQAKQEVSAAKGTLQQYSVKENAERQQHKRSAQENVSKEAEKLEIANLPSQPKQNMKKYSTKMNLEQSLLEREQTDLLEKIDWQTEKERERHIEQKQEKIIQHNADTQTVKDQTQKPIGGLLISENRKKVKNQNEQKPENANIDEIKLINTEQKNGAQAKKEQKNQDEKIKDKANPDDERQEKPQLESRVEKKLQEILLTKTQGPSIQPGSFTVPRLLWTFSQDIKSDSFFVKKCLDAMKRHAAKSSFTMTVLNSKNYKSFIKQVTAQKIERTIELLKERMTKQPYSNLKDYFEDIKRRLIVFHLLNEKGGVFLQKNVLITESFDWLNGIENNIYVNKGSNMAKAKYFGFFDMDHSSHHEKHNKSGAIFEPQKYVVLFPTVEPYFLAAQPNQAFLTETMVEYVELLVNPASLLDKMRKYNLWMEVLRGRNLYFEIFYTSQLIVLHKKQQSINVSGRNNYDDTFAIDEYGLMTMNERYFPKKIAFFFGSYSSEKIYKNIAKYNLVDLEASTGPIRYMTCMPLENEIDQLLHRAREKTERYFINPDSFVGRYLIAKNNEYYLLKDIEKSTVNITGKSWDKLPKLIWFYWDSGIKNSKVVNRLCFDNIRRAAALNNFQIRELNDSNTAQYIGPELNEKINNYLKNRKVQISAQVKSDFIRLAVIIKYGGIYMDLSYFSIKGLEWIVNITQAPSESIFNRYGEVPRVLMFFHPHYGTAFEWTYDKQANTKRMMVSAYESNLMISEPNQQLFQDWLEELGRFITSPYEQTEKLMKDIGTWEHRWTNKDNMYLATMDSVKNVIAKKNKDILDEMKRNPNYKGPTSAVQYYGLWSVSGYREQQKFRRHTNLDFTTNQNYNDKNIFLWRYSDTYVQGLIGNITHLVKLYQWNVVEFNNFLNQDFNSNFSDIHPQSFAAKYLYKPELHKISKKDDKLSLKLLQP